MSRPEKLPTAYFFYDSETEGFSGEAVTAQVCYQAVDYLTASECLQETNEVIFEGVHCIEDCFDHIVKVLENTPHKKAILFAHNAAFDLMRLKNNLPNASVTIQLLNGQMISGILTIGGFTILLRDSYKLLGSSLSDLSKSLTPHLPKLQMNHLQGYVIGNEADRAYALRDVTTLRAVMNAFCSVVNDARTGAKNRFGLNNLKISIAGQALSLMRECLKVAQGDKKDTYQPASKQLNQYLHAHYYRGGMIIIRNNHNPYKLYNAHALDITSSYPYQMSKYEYPIPGATPTRGVKIPTSGRYMVKLQITAYYPDIAILPYRASPETSVIYPTGNFPTYITDSEYQLLITTQKAFYKTLKILEVIHWKASDCSQWAKPFIDVFYGLKSKGDELNKAVKGSGDALRLVGKNLVNNGYGKPAQKYTDDKATDLIRWGDNPEESVFDESKTVKDHRNVAFSAFVTGHARVQLIRAIQYYGAENVVGGDTDSIKIKAEVYNAMPKMPNEGDALGDWKSEGVYRDLQVIAPKVYVGYHTEPGKAEKLEIKAKGLPVKHITLVHNKTDNTYYAPYRSSRDEAQNAEVDALILAHLAECAKLKAEIEVTYAPLPNKLKTFMASGEYARVNRKSLAKPENTKAMNFVAGVYKYHDIDVQ